MNEILKSRMWISFMRSHIEHSIDDMREVVDLTEQHLQKEIKLLSERIDKELKDLDGDGKEDVMDWYVDDIIRLDEIYPDIQRRALLTVIMSMTEANLFLICRMCFRAYKFSHEFKKKKDKQRAIDQALSYLQDKLTINENKLNPHWETIHRLWTIRNALVHNDGKIKLSEEKEVTEFCSSVGSLELDKHKKIKFNKGFVEMAINEVDQFFSRLLEEIKQNSLPN